MRRLWGAALLAAVLALAVPGFAQSPMSPIYPTAPRKSVAPDAAKEVASAPVTTVAPASARFPADDAAVATAVIPPPLPAAPPVIAEPQKPAPAQSQAASAAIPPPIVKWQKRTTRHGRYARRYYAPYYPGPYARYRAATISGWSGGRFGPAPYSASGP
jgi:hypothetical protein